jgi:ERCC4-type nuclease
MNKIIIDTHELGLINLIPETNFPFFSIGTLLAGDIFIAVNNRTVIIERKTIEDYRNTIRTERRNNFDKMLAYPADIRMILIEGPISELGLAEFSNLQHKMIRDHFLVWNTENLKGTMDYILKLYKSMTTIKYNHEKNSRILESITNPLVAPKAIEIAMEILKKFKINPDGIHTIDELTNGISFENILTEIYGISKIRARKIIEIYKDGKTLIMNKETSPKYTKLVIDVLTTVIDEKPFR